MTSPHDRWLANYQHFSVTVYCTNRACPNSEDGFTADYEEEYGQGSLAPEDCPLCHASLVFDPLLPEEEDDA